MGRRSFSFTSSLPLIWRNSLSSSSSDETEESSPAAPAFTKADLIDTSALYNEAPRREEPVAPVWDARTSRLYSFAQFMCARVTSPRRSTRTIVSMR